MTDSRPAFLKRQALASQKDFQAAISNSERLIEIVAVKLKDKYKLEPKISSARNEERGMVELTLTMSSKNEPSIIVQMLVYPEGPGIVEIITVVGSNPIKKAYLGTLEKKEDLDAAVDQTLAVIKHKMTDLRFRRAS